MGNELATPGKQSMCSQTFSSSSAAVGVPGKATLAEALESSPSLDLSRVARRAGQRVVDKGRFEYIVQRDGSFEISKAPVPYTSSKGRRISLEGAPAIWGILHDLLLAQPVAAPAPAPARPPAAMPRGARAPRSASDVAKQDARVRGTKTATLEGGTLEIAQTRAALGNAGTHYRREDASAADVTKMVTGAPDATTFWCSGFSMWTLAAAGYDLDARVLGSDGKPFTYTAIVKDRTPDPEKKQTKLAAARANVRLMKQVTDAGFELAEDELPVPDTITFRKLIDGHALPVLMMSKVEAHPELPGGWLGVVHEPVNAFAGLIDGPDNTSLAAMGAPGAFELLGIGNVIPESEQKPGDFAQERWLVNGAYTGAGHAFQVWSITASGSARFGETGSPEPVDPSLRGWHEGVRFRITKDTEPSLVGEHVVVSATRIEANTNGAFAVADKKQPVAGDGGVQITGEHAVPNVNRNHAGSVVFYGRLGASPWARWTKATKPAKP